MAKSFTFKIPRNHQHTIVIDLEFFDGSDFDVIIGVEILSHCDFAFTGKSDDLYFSLQIPHLENIIDFTN